MESEGYAPSTIGYALGYLANFYNWCDERQIDPECEPGFNPAAGVKRPRVERYATAKLLNEGEVERLLGILQRDDSALGKRDYALILARLRLGVPLGAIRKLWWGQLRPDEQEALLPQWELRDRLGQAPVINTGQVRDRLRGELRDTVQVRWREEGEFVELPEEVSTAILDYLTTSGRLEGMGAEDYIFAPLAVPGIGADNTSAGDWGRGRCVCYRTMRVSLKLYGRLAGIPKERLTLYALRNTAIRLQLDAGKSIKEMQVFLDSRGQEKHTKYKLGKLPPMPEDGAASEQGEIEIQLPNRKPHHFQPGHGLIHGYYVLNQPAEAVLAVLAEEIEGIEEQISD
jgi:DNA-binding transcriptional MerR regulator